MDGLSSFCSTALESREQDWQWLTAALEGDGTAFEKLVTRHQVRLHRLCHRLLGDAGEAEDAVQETFLRLFRRGSRYEPQGQLFTLLYRIATNYCLNRLRRRRLVRFVPLRKSSTPEGATLEIEPEDERGGQEAELEARRQWQRTVERIDRLPASQRVVLILVRLEGLSYKETAATLGITVGAVESRLVRAMRSLSETRKG